MAGQLEHLLEISQRPNVIIQVVSEAEAIMLFEDIRSYALSAAESRAMIQEALQRWKNHQ